MQAVRTREVARDAGPCFRRIPCALGEQAQYFRSPVIEPSVERRGDACVGEWHDEDPNVD
eukprot:1259436-Pleurochrysis_carterae.AAC.2